MIINRNLQTSYYYQNQVTKSRQSMNDNEPLEQPQICFNELQATQEDYHNLLAFVDDHLVGSTWQNSHKAITNMRLLNKFHPQTFAGGFQKYGDLLQDLIGNGKTQITKNILRLSGQIFSMGRVANIQKSIYALLPIVIKKAALDIGHIKQMANQALTILTINCAYDITFIVLCQLTCDKNNQMAEISLLTLGGLLKNVENNIMKLSQKVLILLVHKMMMLIQGKRNDLKNMALDVCIFVCGGMGSQHYMQLMNFCLNAKDVNLMATSMDTHRVTKQKPEPLMSTIKKKRQQKWNQQINKEDVFDWNQYN